MMLTALTALLVLAPQKVPDAAATVELRKKVDEYFSTLADAKVFAGSVLVAKRGKMIVGRSYGKADIAAGIDNTPTTACKIMSVTKVITAVAMMTLHQAGKLSVEDPIGKHLPGLPKAWHKVKIKQLLSHTSRIPNSTRAWTMTTRREGGRGLAMLPGMLKRLDKSIGLDDKSNYSNFNFVLASLIIEAASGQAYPEYLQKAVLDKAGMSLTGIDDGSRRKVLAIGYSLGKEGSQVVTTQDMSHIQAAGGIYSTVGDLFRLDQALRGVKLLTAKTKAVMYTMQSDHFALGWRITKEFGRTCIQHSGGANGYVADFLRFPEQDVCVVVMSNFAYTPIGRVSHDLAAMALGEKYECMVKLTKAQLDSYAGLYKRGEHSLLLRRSGTFMLAITTYSGGNRGGPRVLLPIGKNRFPVQARQLEILMGDGGQSKGAQFYYRGKVNERMVRVRGSAANR